MSTLRICPKCEGGNATSADACTTCGHPLGLRAKSDRPGRILAWVIWIPWVAAGAIIGAHYANVLLRPLLGR